MQAKITDTILRDAHQSLLATRLRTADMVPLLHELDQVGYWSVEMWGGATFDTCLRFLREDPWERLRTVRRGMPNTRLQMLLRGQNVVGYRHYADDVVRLFVARAAKAGVDVFRIFDALNDLRNMEVAIQAVKDAGKLAEGALSYTLSPVHDVPRFVLLARRLAALGCDTIAIKDMAGLLSPAAARDLVGALVREVGLPVHLHCHATSGMASTAYWAGLEAGAEILDTALSPLGGGTSQPPTESVVAMLRGTPHDTGLDLTRLDRLAELFKGIRKKYKDFESEYTGVDTRVLTYQIPGGMISNLASQLKEMGALDRMEEVLAEVPRVRADLGYPPLVTPSSQIVGTQAVFNVVAGARYEVVTKETREYLLGRYGQPPVPVAEEVLARAVGDAPRVTVRPADLLEPELPRVQAEGGDLVQSEEDLLSLALFPGPAREFLEYRRQGGERQDALLAAAAAAAWSLRQTERALHVPGRGAEAHLPASPGRAWRQAGRWELLGGRAGGR
ncbi:MAG: pyruvate carboxylase subunit B [Myxococcota bacterium]|nr:pyruvate carboxylase subunit B [Myxococcota bacterium]